VRAWADELLSLLKSLRRRFEQNQEDCTYTVLALLPTVRDEIIGALPVEQISEQLQHERQERLKRSGGQSDAASTEYPSVPPSVADEDGKSLSSGSYVHASQMAGSTTEAGALPPRPRRTKAQLWQDMKINSIARALTLIYTLSLLSLLTRIQLNLLGRRTYLSSVVALASPPAAAQSSTISLENRDDDNHDNVYGNDFETNRKYLTFSWWLLHRGSKQILERVTRAVREVFGQVNIREDITLERLAELILQVRRRIEGATEKERYQMRWLPYLLPSHDDEAFVIRQSGLSEGEESPSPEAAHTGDPMSAAPADEEPINGSLRRLLDETSDLIDSPTFSQVLTRLLDAAYSHLIDYKVATEAYQVTGPVAPGIHNEPRVTEVTDKTCKLAHILPVFCRQAHMIAAGSGELDAIAANAAQEALGNEYLAAIDRVRDLEAFAAVIYSSNFEYEVAERSSSSTIRRGSPDFETSPAAVLDGPTTIEPEPGFTEVVAADGALVETEVVEAVPAAARQDTVRPGAEERSGESSRGGGDALEAAWKKALAEEDGQESSAQ